ncbi:MAG: BCAM0308 family protein [Rhodothermales bacterium]
MKDTRRKGTVGQRERFKDERHDVYLERKKWPEPTSCGTCGAVYQGGRWTWSSSPAGGNVITCPACQRIADNYPAGFVELQGPFFAAHRDEIRGLIDHIEENEKGEHPLERVMRIEDAPDRVLIETTGIHLARRIGTALERAYEGHLTFKFGDGMHTIRVTWER